MTAYSRPKYDPTMFAPEPARDKRFKVVNQWIDCQNLPEGDPQREVEFLHRQMNEEVDGMECSSRNLADFPDATWELRMCIARQCYDEARHVEMFLRLYKQRGGKIGQYPVLNFQFRIITSVDNLYGRLAVQNVVFESEGLDAVEPEIDDARLRGDHALADLFDSQLADEICHVRYANEHVSGTASSNPATVMQVGRALDYANRAFVQVHSPESIAGVQYSVNQKARVEAGFRPEHVQAMAENRKRS